MLHKMRNIFVSSFKFTKSDIFRNCRNYLTQTIQIPSHISSNHKAFSFSLFACLFASPFFLDLERSKNFPSDPRVMARSSIADAVELASPSVVKILNGHACGSGFVFKDDYVVTNCHVITGGGFSSHRRNIELVMQNGETVSGVVHGKDEESDLAVIKILTNKKYPTISIGSSNKLRVGEWVIALGSALTLQNTVTTGIVSATGRDGREIGLSAKREFIQTDASINAGNSGGPLINLDGEVVGINTFKAIGDGISFAIPIDFAMPIIEELISNKQVVRGYIGFTLVTECGLPAKSGESDCRVTVAQVEPGSPASIGGLQKDDIILEFNGITVHETKDIAKFFNFKVNQKIELQILRGNTKMKMTITAKAHPNSNRSRN